MAIKLQGIETQAQARVGERLPQAVAATGATAQAAGDAFGRLSARIGQLADEAAQREGALAGQAAGAAAGDARSPLTLRRDGTIRGEAADAAAMEAYGWRLETRLRNGVGEAWLANRDDPEALDKAFADLRGGLEQEIGPDPALRESFGKRFAGLTQNYRDQAAERRLAHLETEKKANFVDAWEAIGADLERRSYDAAGRPMEAEQVQAEIRRSLARLDMALESRTVSPLEAQAFRRGLLQRAEIANLRGGFDLLEGDPEGQRRYAENLDDLWSRGEIGGDALDLQTVQGLASGMIGKAAAEINRREMEENRTQARAERALAEWKEASLVGLPLTPERQAELMAEISPAGESYVRRAQAAERRTGLYQRFALTPPAERAAALDRWRRGGGATADDVDLFGKLQHLDQGLTDAEERIRAAALREGEQERKELEREARAEQRRLASEKDKLLQEMLGDQAASAAAGLPYAYGPQLAAAVQGTKFEGEYNRNLAIGDLWQTFREAPPEGKAAIAAQLRALPAPDKRHVQFIGELERDADQALKELGTELTKRFNEHLTAFGKGFELESFAADLGEIQARDPDLGLALNRAYTDFVNLKNAAGALPWELAPKTLAGGMPLPRDAREAATYAEYERMKGQAAKQWADDRMAGPWAQNLPPFDATDPASVQDRVLSARAIMQQGSAASEVVYTSKAERETNKEAIRAASPTQQQAIYDGIVNAAGPDALPILRELDAPAAILFAAEGRLAGGLGGDVFRAAAIGAATPKSVTAPPSAENQRAWAAEIVGRVFDQESDVLAQVMETASAIYVARAGVGADPKEGKELWTKAFQEALGAQGDLGGVRSVAERATVLPPGMAAREAEFVLDMLDRHGLRFTETDWDGLLYGGARTYPIENRAWIGITSNGAAPVVRGQMVDGDVLSELSVRAVKGGRYMLEAQDKEGGYYPLEDPVTGAPVTFDLSALAIRFREEFGR